MNIVVVGTGHVGLVTGACFAEMGIRTFCLDSYTTRICQLRQGIIPIYEPELNKLIQKNIRANRLHFATITDWEQNSFRMEVIFITVATPSDADGNVDLQNVLAAAHSIGKIIENHVLVVIKSTVPVGTSVMIKKVIKEELNKRNIKVSFDVAANPEFLQEGTAVKDFMYPDRIVVGIESLKAKKTIDKLYKSFILKNYQIIYTDILSAEMIKYVSNAMLATRVSFINEISNLCTLLGVDINMVRRGIGSDSRIGNKFLYSGCGYGGSCFKKDIKALIIAGSKKGYTMNLLKSVEKVNNQQKIILFKKLVYLFKNKIKDKIITIWGLSFKPNTEDMREAPSLAIINLLLQKKAVLQVYDPIAIPEARKLFGDKLHYYENMYDAAKQSDALLLLTEWNEFQVPSWKLLKNKMNQAIILDGRNIYSKKEVQLNGFKYISI